MKPEIEDAQQTLEYGHSHDLARNVLPFTLFAILLGLFLMTSLGGAQPRPRDTLIGGIVIAVAVAFLGVVIYRRSQPSVASIVLSPSGVLFRDISDKPIPWNEIREVGAASVSAPKDFWPSKVTKLVVSKRYFQSLGLSWPVDSVIAKDGEPSEIYLSYYHGVPFDEFHAAVRHRWLAFSRHAEGSPFPETHRAQPVWATAASRSPGPPQREGSIQRARSFEGTRALGALIRDSSPGQLIVIAASVIGILVLLTNQTGLWSTPAQERWRAKAAEWRAWKQKFEADQKATDEQQRRIREMLDKRFECMNEYWARHDRGVRPQDPDCMNEQK